MRIYADTSALLAWFNPDDQFARPVTQWCREKAPEFCWNPLLQIELRHQLRKLSGKYAAVAWQAYRAGESSRRLKLDLARLPGLLERADELSARYAQTSKAGTWDFVHVAVSEFQQAEIFITCDVAQAELARQMKEMPVRLFS